MNIDNFINTCESLIIEYDHDLYLSTVATEGVNWDVAKIIRSSDVKEARKLITDAKKMGNRKEYDEAIQNLKRALGIIVTMKNKVNNMPEDDSIVSRTFRYFTPLFTTLQPTKFNKYGTSSFFRDKLSDDTDNILKQTIQLRFNLLIHEIDLLVKKYVKEIKNNG